MSDINHNTVAWMDFKVDVYAGNPCGSKPESFIESYFDGDMGSERIDSFTFDASRFPPGTKVLIQVPCCPECNEGAELTSQGGKCQCGFDWAGWYEEQFS